MWLTQSDNLHLIQWYGRSGPEAEVSAYFTPREWWDLGPNGVIHEQQQVYLNALHAMEPYLPVRAVRRSRSKTATKAVRREAALVGSHSTAR
jgi:alpha-amylase